MGVNPVMGIPDRETLAEFTEPRPEIGGSNVRGWTTANDNELGRHNDEDTLAWWRRHLSSIPAEATAVIEPDPLAFSHAGRARRDGWRLRFPMRDKPFVDWLMGWTGGADPLANVVLNFSSRASAEEFCALQGIRFDAVDHSASHHLPVNKQAFELDNDKPIEFG